MAAGTHNRLVLVYFTMAKPFFSSLTRLFSNVYFQTELLNEKNKKTVNNLTQMIYIQQLCNLVLAVQLA